MEDKKEEIVKLVAEVKDLRNKEDEIYEQARDLLGLEEFSRLEYYFFDTFFNDGNLDEFWKKYLKEV